MKAKRKVREQARGFQRKAGSPPTGVGEQSTALNQYFRLQMHFSDFGGCFVCAAERENYSASRNSFHSFRKCATEIFFVQLGVVCQFVKSSKNAVSRRSDFFLRRLINLELSQTGDEKNTAQRFSSK